MGWTRFLLAAATGLAHAGVAAPAGAAAAWIELQEPAEQPVYAAALTVPAAEGYAVVVSAPTGNALLAYDAADRLRWSRAATSDRVTRTPDARLLVHGFDLRSFSADGTLQWVVGHDSLAARDGNVRIRELAAGSGGVAWTRLENVAGSVERFVAVRAFGRDGTVLLDARHATLRLESVARVLPLPGARAAIVVGRTPAGRAAAVRLGLDGSVAWHQELADAATGGIDAALHADEAVTIVAIVGASERRERVVARLDANGTVLSLRRDPASDAVLVTVAAFGDDVAVLERGDAAAGPSRRADPLALARLAPDGAERWRAPLGPIARCASTLAVAQDFHPCRLAVAGERFVVSVVPAGSGPDAPPRLVLVEADGRDARRVDVDDVHAFEADAVRGGVVALAAPAACPAASGACRLQVGADGAPGPLLPLSLVRRPRQPGFRAVATSDGSVVLSRAAFDPFAEAPGALVLRGLRADGTERWRRTAGVANEFERIELVRTRGAVPTVCLAYAPHVPFPPRLAPPAPHVLACHDERDGSLLGAWRTPFVRGFTLLRALAGGDLLVAGAPQCAGASCAPLYGVSADARTATPVGVDPVLGIVDVAASGDLVYARYTGSTLLTGRLAPDGSVRNVARIDGLGGLGSVHAVGAGELLLLATTFERGEWLETASLIGADGAVRWRRYTGYLAAPARVLAAGDSIFVTAPKHDGTAHLLRFGRTDDSGDWRRRVPQSTRSNADLVPSPDASEVALVVGEDGALVVRTLSARDGAVLAALDVPCGTASWCNVTSTELAPDGRLHVAVARGTDGARDMHDESGALVRVDWPRAPAARVAARIDGAWHSPHRPERGVLVGTIGDAVFATAFASDATRSPDAASLAWRTFEGRVGASGAVALTQHRNRGGAFATRPATLAEPLPGHAALHVDDCGHATLMYDDAGVHRVHALERLTRAARGCAAARPAAVEGSWYAPGAAGQGLQIAVHRGATPAEDLLFAGWLTYDVDGRSNDFASQHWFSLQGPAPEAPGAAAVVVSIAQTSGAARASDGPSRNALAIGTAELTLVACDRLRLRYRFHAVPEARAFAGLAGERELVRLGACE